MNFKTKEMRYCESCKKETTHEIEVERDASNPPEEFVEALEEGYASNADCIFYANGDSDWRVTCLTCFNNYLEG